MVSHRKVLVVEDDDETRELMRMMLERRGYFAITAEDGIRGYEQAISSRPDLIITDITMPGADGVHLVRRIRDTNAIANVPILVITGYGTGNATFALAHGASAYEPKPLDMESFLATVKRLLKQAG